MTILSMLNDSLTTATLSDSGLAKTIRDYGGLSESDLRLWTETKNNVKSKYFHDPVEGVESTFYPRPWCYGAWLIRDVRTQSLKAHLTNAPCPRNCCGIPSKM